MRFALLFFSGTGNTKWAVETLSSFLVEKGGTVSVFNLENNFEFQAKDYDTIIFAHPIYGAHVPRLVSEKIPLLIPGNISVTIIATFGFVNALGYFAEKKAVGRKIDSYFNLKMFNNISTPRMKMNIKNSNKRLSFKSKLENKLEKISTSIIEGKHKIQGLGPQLLVGIKIRKAFHEELHTHYQTLSVDPERCTLCGQCVRECPTHSISEKNAAFTFHATCTACMRCYNFCPTQAIIIDGKFADPDIYPRYLGPWE